MKPVTFSEVVLRFSPSRKRRFAPAAVAVALLALAPVLLPAHAQQAKAQQAQAPSRSTDSATGASAVTGASASTGIAAAPDPLSRAFELRYVSGKQAADGVTDFKGATAVFDTPQRIEYLGRWATYAKRFFDDPALNTKVFDPERVETALDRLKPPPAPEIRSEVPIKDWTYLGYREGQRAEEQAQLMKWESTEGARVVPGGLLVEGTEVERKIRPQSWRALVEWTAQVPEASGGSATFHLSDAVEVGVNERGAVYYVTGGKRKQATGAGEPGARHRFKVELDLSAKEGRYTFFVDGEKVANFVPLSTKTDSASRQSFNAFEVATENEVILENLHVTSFIGPAPYGREEVRSYPYLIETGVDQDFEVPPSPDGFEEPGYDPGSAWAPTPYRRYAHGGERNAGEALYLRKTVEVGAFERAVLDVETVRPAGTIYLNGQKVQQVGRHPARIDVSDRLKQNAENLIAVRVEPHNVGAPIYLSEEAGYRRDYHPKIGDPFYHMSTDTHSSWFAGLMHLELTAETYVENVFAHATDTEDPATLRVQVQAHSEREEPFTGELVAEVTPWYPEEAERPAATASTSIQVDGTTEETVDVPVPDPRLWTPASPHLYKVRVILKDKSGQSVDDKVVTSGLRTVSQEGGTFRLNGEPAMLNGPLIFGHYRPVERIAQWMFSPPKRKWVEQILAAKRMNSTALRMSVHDSRVGGTNDRRLAQIADQLGIMLIWQTPAWVRVGTTENFDFSGLARYAQAVCNHPSIVMWQPGNHPSDYPSEWFSRVVDTLAEADPSRLISPAADLAHMDLPGDAGNLASWPSFGQQKMPNWTHPQTARGNMVQTLAYGAEWSQIRRFGQGYDDVIADLHDEARLAYLQSDTHAWFDFESEETIGQPNWRLRRGMPDYHMHSYEKDYDTGSIGRVLRFSEWQESQAWQALSAYEAYRKKRWLGYDGMLWCPLRGGGNTATYMKPAVDYAGHAKLAFHALRAVFQPVLAGSRNVDLVYGPDDTIPTALLHLGGARTVDVHVAAKTMDGETVAETRYEDVELPAGKGKIELGSWDPGLEPGRYYGIEYMVLR